MSLITKIDISHHRLPLDPPFKASWDGRTRDHAETTVVRVTDSDGRQGIGSGDTMLGFAGHEDLFIGHNPKNTARHARVLANIAFHYGRCWPLDIAIWDLAAKADGQPLWKMLRGTTSRVRLYASSGVLRDADAMADQAQSYVDAGFPAMKVRFSSAAGGRHSWEDDVAAVAAIRDRVGPDMAIMVDFNQGWRMPWDTAPAWTSHEALTVIRALEPLDIYWVEEPVHRGDIAGMQQLRAETSVRIAGGEMNRELHEFTTLIDQQAVDVIQPDVVLTGGLTGVRDIAQHATASNVRFTPHSWTNGIGVAANAHAFAAYGNGPWLEFPLDPPEWSLERRDFALTTPLVADQGWLELGDTAGLGVELDEDRLWATRVDS